MARSGPGPAHQTQWNWCRDPATDMVNLGAKGGDCRFYLKNGNRFFNHIVYRGGVIIYVIIQQWLSILTVGGEWKPGHGFSVKVNFRPWLKCQSGQKSTLTLKPWLRVSKWISGHGHNSTLTLKPWPKVDFDTEAMAWVQPTPNCLR